MGRMDFGELQYPLHFSQPFAVRGSETFNSEQNPLFSTLI